jgi:hypothetical protein
LVGQQLVQMVKDRLSDKGKKHEQKEEKVKHLQGTN